MNVSVSGAEHGGQTTIDHRDDDEQGRGRGAVVLPETTATSDAIVGGASAPAEGGSEQGGLHAVDDDALTDVSDLNLGDTVEDQSAPIKRPSNGVRELFTCKGFLKHCSLSILRKAYLFRN
ncbi:hypothetical protein EW145_g5005 [Phellinidium pouzarii]|uniref:Uncharacterized protein n=1 Tax=Phellinidium pouzarii TaxID=167371 RepID=A0A4S4L1I8_9AGAM|nr:hypothetical protein EW145_g5005 [Phellinidium pouzarii]